MSSPEIAAATAEANDAAERFINDGNATFAERSALAADYRQALARLADLTNGNMPPLDALRIPTAPHAAPSMTRDEVKTALAAEPSDSEPLDHHAHRCFTEPVREVYLQAGPDGSVR
jgi:hypothetical protein